MNAKKDPSIFLQHILESIQEIVRNTENISAVDFAQSVPIQDAVIRRLEIIGEAVRNVPISFRRNYPEIPWKKIAGMRDVLIHEYFGVDIELVWMVIEKDIPELKKQIQGIVEKE